MYVQLTMAERLKDLRVIDKKLTLEQLAEQICETQSMEGLTFSDDSRYTSQVLLDAISKTLEKAQISQSTQSNPKNQSAENNEGEMP